MVAFTAAVTITIAAALSDSGLARSLGFLGVLAGFFIGGFLAGRDAPRRPHQHGAAAGLLGWLGAQVVFAVVLIVRSGEFDAASVLGVVFAGMLLTTTAMMGAMLSATKRFRRPETTEGTSR